MVVGISIKEILISLHLLQKMEALEQDLLLKEQELLALQNDSFTDADAISDAQELVDSAQSLYDQALMIADEAKITQAGIETEYGDIFNSDTQSIEFDADDLGSNGRFAGIGWFEVGATIGSKWSLKSGKTISAGVTVKSVHIELFDYVASVSSLDTGDIDGDDYRTQ